MGYRRRTEARLAASTWNKEEAARNAVSSEFRKESDFRAHAAKAMRGVFHTVKEEVPVWGVRRRIDIVVEQGLWRFGVELKNGNRTARLDQTLGQAIVKCHAMGGMQPVCCVPDDVQPDKVFVDGCRSVGAIAGTLTECIKAMQESCQPPLKGTRTEKQTAKTPLVVPSTKQFVT